jgi:hypothetical protein
MVTCRDTVLEALSDSETRLLERLEDMRAERDAYRLVAREAIHYCHTQHVALMHLRANHRRVVDEFRAARQRQTVRQWEVP